MDTVLQPWVTPGLSVFLGHGCPLLTFSVSVIKYHDVSNLRKGLFWFMFKGAVPLGGEVMATGPWGKTITLHTQPGSKEG